MKHHETNVEIEQKRNKQTKIGPFNRRMQIECLLLRNPTGRPHSYDLRLFERESKRGKRHKAHFISQNKVGFENYKSKLVKSQAQMNISIATCNNDLKYASPSGFLTV